MKILIANRGEIAVRIIHACHELGHSTVAIYTKSDTLSQHVRSAEEAILLDSDKSYLDIELIIRSAKKCNAQAIHPGYGFLSENKDFAKAVEDAGMIFIGPRPETLALTGDKLIARQTAQKAGVQILAGTNNPVTEDDFIKDTTKYNYPILVKASSGGGGRGIRLVKLEEELPAMIKAARREALATFGNTIVFLEELVPNARHIEVQIIGDGNGNVIVLGERECSMQRRRQKIIEEAPACNLDPKLRDQIHLAAQRLGRYLNFRSLGTVEFLLDQEGNYFFIEINPRIQVEHPVTEMITGIDLVREQLLLITNGKLRFKQEDIQIRGHSIEARILAEDPEANFMPSTGQINFLQEPSGAGIRIDSALYNGMSVTSEYDSMLAKLIVWDENRSFAIKKMKRALQEFYISGIVTDIQFLLQIINHPDFQNGQYNTSFLDRFSPQNPILDMEQELAIAAAIFTHAQNKTKMEYRHHQTNAWLVKAWQEQMTNN